MAATFSVSLFLFCLLLPSGFAAAGIAMQQVEQVDVTKQISEQLKVLRNGKATPAERQQAVEQLLLLDWRGPQKLAQEMERQIRSLRKIQSAKTRKLSKAFGMKAKALVAKRLKGKTQKEIQELRQVVLANAQDLGLSKKQIQEQSDPAMQRLQEILTVDLAQVWQVDVKLQADHQELLQLLQRDGELYANWSLATARLQEHAKTPAAAKRFKKLAAPLQPKSLQDELQALADQATPMSKRDRNGLASNESLLDELDPEEYLGVLELNRIRILLGLQLQLIDLKLVAACRGHSKDMKEHNFFAHNSPVLGRETPWKRAALEGTDASAENILKGINTGKAAIWDWWYSPGHHRNMLIELPRTGLGRFEEYWTQLFG